MVLKLLFSRKNVTLLFSKKINTFYDMASIRNIKKDLTYLVNEVISDASIALYFQPADRREALFAIINKAAELNNSLLDRINRPAEKHNRSLVRKHYAQIRREMNEGVENLFAELSQACKTAKAE